MTTHLTPSPNAVRLERTYDAPAEAIWELWTTAAGLEEWFAPDGFESQVRELELRPGGQLRFTMTATAPEQVAFLRDTGNPLSVELRKTFTEIAPPTRLAYRSLPRPSRQRARQPRGGDQATRRVIAPDDLAHRRALTRLWQTGTVPEGDAVWNTAKRLHAALAGQVLTRSDFRVPRYATVSLTGQLVTEAVARGKHLLIRTDRGLTVHTHLKMEGAWRIQPADGRPLRDSHRLRLLLANSQWVAAGYQLGITEVLPTSREDQVIGHLGPDLLGPDWDAAAAVARLAGDPGRPVGEALLDQRNLAGLGTIYMSETLFLRGVDPSRSVGSVDELPALVGLGHRLLDANKERAGHVTTGDARPGRENWVYGRAGRPCRRCGTLIRRGEAGPPGQERVRFWCPNCQR